MCSDLCENPTGGQIRDAGNAQIYPTSLLHAEGPERLVKTTGLGVLDQCLPGRFATLCAGKFLCRYHGAIDSPEPAHDDQNMGHHILLTVSFGGARFGCGKQSLASPGVASMSSGGPYRPDDPDQQ